MKSKQLTVKAKIDIASVGMPSFYPLVYPRLEIGTVVTQRR